MHHGRAPLYQPEHIAPLHRRKPRVEIILNDRAINNRHLRRSEMEIQRLGQAERLPILGEISMGHLRRGMNAGIGAPRRRDRMIALFQPRQSRLNRALHGGVIGLPLPSCEGRAVVFDFESISGHIPVLAPRAAFRNHEAALAPSSRPPARLCLGRSFERWHVGIGSLTDDLLRGIEGGLGSVSGALFDPVLRVGVTGLSRAGKTVFITSLIANLMDRGRMPALTGAAHVQAAFLQPQPDDTIPRFDFEGMLGALTGPDPHWPEGTRAISELRLSFRIQPTGILGAIRGPRTLHLDIVDYPGEWLLDLGLMNVSFAEWSKSTLARMPRRPLGPEFLALLKSHSPEAKLEEPNAQALAAAFTAHLNASRAAGFSDCSPGRFLLPGEMAGSPALTFAPLPDGAAPRGSLAREFERRFEAYKSQIVKPFFRDHFAKIDRQVVLVDVLGAVHSGPEALEDLRRAMGAILTAFRPGQTGFLGSLIGRKRIEKILFAATKADHLHHTQHPRLTAITEALLREARDRANFAGAETAAMSIASLRTTTEEELAHPDGALPAVRGKLMDGRSAALYPGELPSDPAKLLSPARAGAEKWLDGDYSIMGFAPAAITLRPNEGPPHIRLDRAAQFLIGDKL